jgi:hypothetical protein
VGGCVLQELGAPGRSVEYDSGCLQMRVVLNESGRLWARAYDKKFKTNYLDEKFEQLPAGTVVNVRKGACAVQWDSDNRDFRTDDCFFSYSTGSYG